MGTIGYLLGVENTTLGAVYREFTKALNIEISTIGIMDMLESFCYDFKLGPQQIEVFAERPQRLVDRTSALIELAADAWIVTGRQPLPLLMAAVYLAWQSLNPMVSDGIFS
ncbi:transcription factor IIIB 50 kDa subunit-like [Sinocyclocheilus anshuiensis]|uniref:transcription factor IIIB 50 kDa subunit-like n=1 Tax=Sinocyclocheilus anshuiensis TaxID=1608454 RepID=UPI0007B7C61F|nr:PREDICTED: transcription factor IIIB 50 kDa subunit-like [Sinocyclocheilus anshuiensis]